MQGKEINSELCTLFTATQKIVGFYIHALNVQPDQWMRELGVALRQRGYGTVGLLTEQSKKFMHLDGMDAVYTVCPQDIIHLERINCFIVTDFESADESVFKLILGNGKDAEEAKATHAGCDKFGYCGTAPSDTVMGQSLASPPAQSFYPLSSRVLGCIHSTSPNIPQAYLQGAQFTRYFDGYLLGFPCAPVKEQMQRLWDDFTPGHTLCRPATDFTIVLNGYPRLGTNISQIQALQKAGIQEDSICYAPTVIDYNLQCGGYRVKNNGTRIIRCLLDNFQEKNVIFRPAILNIEHPHVQEIVRKFADEPRFIFDISADYAHTMCRSSTIITDLSHFATSFNICTLRSAVHFTPWSVHTDFTEDGWGNPQAKNFTQLIKSVRHVLTKPAQAQEKLLRTRDATLIPPEGATENLASTLGDFIDGNPRPEWISIKRSAHAPGASLARVIRAILSEYYTVQASLAILYWQFFGKTLPYTAFALHMHKLLAPGIACWDDLWAAATKSLDFQQKPEKFEDVSSSYLEALYTLASEDAHAAQDKETEFLLRQLAKAAQKGLPLRLM